MTTRFSPVDYAERGEREHALRVAADLLAARQPAQQILLRVAIGPNRLNAEATWSWPGVVRVELLPSGALLAESVPGRPHELAGP